MAREADNNAAFQHADVEWRLLDDGASRLRSVRFDDIYFSGEGPSESDHVFVSGNRLAARFGEASRFAIGELGFGTGLNFLVAWRLWDAHKKRPGASLDFFSVEKFPVAPVDLDRAHEAWPELADRAARLRERCPPAAPGLHRISVAPDVYLTLAFGDAAQMLARMEGRFDAWFLDGFSPAKNPEMWTREVFQEITRLSRPGATASTFTVAGAVRRNLADAGFAIERSPGFGRKKEMLTAVFRGRPDGTGKRKPWHAPAPGDLAPGGRVAVIGAGVAGASLARAALRRGLSPTVFDPFGPATGASGNPGGLVMPRLDLGEAPAARFFRQAYIHVVGLLADLEQETSAEIFNPCGVLLKATDEAGRARIERLAAAPPLPPEWMEARDDGLFFPQAGVVDPRALVAALIEGAQILTERVEQIVDLGEEIAVRTDAGRRVFDRVVIANGVSALRLLPARSLPLSPVAGQIDWFPGAPSPQGAVAAGPYLGPAPGGGMICGATYDRRSGARSPAASLEASRENIAAAARIAPHAVKGLDPARSRPRTAIRCQTPDRLPVAGPLPDWRSYAGDYDDLRFGRPLDYPSGRMQRGLFILSGLGSRGLVTAPLCADFVMSEIAGAPSALEASVAEILHPARFFIRDFKRAQPRKPYQT